MDKLNRKLAEYRVESGRQEGKCQELAKQIINLMPKLGVMHIRYRGGSLFAQTAELIEDHIIFSGTRVDIKDIVTVEVYGTESIDKQN